MFQITRFQIRRFVASRRGVVALESALATFPLLLCLSGMLEIVLTVFTGDLLQRAAHRVARANALAATPAASLADLTTLVRTAIDQELGTQLSYELRLNTACPEPSSSDRVQAVAYCLSASIEVYSSPVDLSASRQVTQTDTTGYGGGSKEMVVVRLHMKPRSVSGRLRQALFGATGPAFRAMAVMRNEERL